MYVCSLKYMFTGLLHIHSFLRWIILFLLVFTVVKAFSGWLRKKPFEKLDNKLSLFSMIAVHTQLLFGISLYFLSGFVRAGWSDLGNAMKDPVLRFWSVEHNFGMLCAIALITAGRIGLKKIQEHNKKHQRIALYYLFALLIIFFSIPWPFSIVSRPWF